MGVSMGVTVGGVSTLDWRGGHIFEALGSELLFGHCSELFLLVFFPNSDLLKDGLLFGLYCGEVGLLFGHGLNRVSV